MADLYTPHLSQSKEFLTLLKSVLEYFCQQSEVHCNFRPLRPMTSLLTRRANVRWRGQEGRKRILVVFLRPYRISFPVHISSSGPFVLDDCGNGDCRHTVHCHGVSAWTRVSQKQEQQHTLSNKHSLGQVRSYIYFLYFFCWLFLIKKSFLRVILIGCWKFQTKQMCRQVHCQESLGSVFPDMTLPAVKRQTNERSGHTLIRYGH